MIAKISTATYQNNKKWLKKHPELSVGCYVHQDKDGEISIRLERISDITTNTGRIIPGWVEVPYPDFLQSTIIIPKHCIDEHEHHLFLEWIE